MTDSLDLKPNNYQNIEEIFKVTVQTTRTILKCDRVIIYDASDLPTTEVIAESVDSKYASILGQTISDPFIEGEYLELYCFGQPVAIDNVNATDLSKTQLDSLRQLNIQSLAIAPISLGKELLAFLVAHQCSKPQPWHPEAIKLLKEKANTTSFALSNIAKAEKSTDSNFIKPTANIQENGNPSTMERKEKSNGNNNGDIQNLQQKTMLQEDRSKLFSDVKNEIAGEVGQENILHTTVNELRHLLNCDRVITYNLNQDNYG